MQTSLSAALPSSRLRSETVECPKCSKRSIVKRSPTTFDCLNCNFHKELPPVATDTLLAPNLRNFSPHPRRSHPTHAPHYSLPEPSGSIAEDNQAKPLVFAAVIVILIILFL